MALNTSGIHCKQALKPLLICFTLIQLLLAVPAIADVKNPQEAGSGCVIANQTEQLGTVENRLASRTFVPVGVDDSSPFLQQLSGLGPVASTEAFLGLPQAMTGQLSNNYMLLVNAREVTPQELRNVPGVSKALASNVPIVLENFTRDHIKALTGLGIDPKAGAVLVNSEPGGRAFTITAIDKPEDGFTPEFIQNAVNRALGNRSRLTGGSPPVPERQAYALKIWDVWFTNADIVCKPPYDPGAVMQSQTGNVDFGIEFTLVAGTEPAEKALNMQYIGTGFSPVAPGVTPIDINRRFKGAFTLELDYKGKLTAPPDAQLTGTADTVTPATAVNQHTVAKTSGFTAGLNFGCGVGKTGPNCQVGGNFSWTSSKTNTETIAERAINATSSFGTTEADHGITYLVSSTATSDGGVPIDLLNNNWYGFFHHGSTETRCLLKGQWFEYEAGCPVEGGQLFEGRAIELTDDHPYVRDWPKWAQNSAMTEGMAGYTMNAKFTGDLTLDASFTAKEGIFALGEGPHGGRNRDTDLGLVDWYRMHLYTDSYTTASKIVIDANDVNYSGMPTCSMRQYSQSDMGIWAVENNTNYLAVINPITASPSTEPITIQPFDYVGSRSYLAGLTAKEINPGQYQYVALCSANTADTGVAISIPYDNGHGTKGSLDFTGNGSYYLVNGQPTDPHVRIDKESRVITIDAIAPKATTTSLTSSPNPSSYGQSVTFKAAVDDSAASGTMSFKDGNSLTLAKIQVVNGAAEYSTQSLAKGAHAITASYSGDSSHAPSTSEAVSQTVNPVQPTVSVASDSNPSSVGTAVTFTASVTSPAGTPTGSVTFNDGGAPLGTAKLSATGTATLTVKTLTQGTHQITAVYMGDSNFGRSESAPLTQTVLGGPVRPLVQLTVQPSTATVGQTVTFTVKVSYPGGPVPTGNITVSDDSTTPHPKSYVTAILDASGTGIANYSAFPAGHYNLVATYGGDNNYYGAQSNTVELTVQPPGADERPTLAIGAAMGASLGTPQPVSLTVKNSGAAETAAIMLNQISLRTLAGSGTGTLVSPLPVAVGSLAPGESRTVTVMVQVPTAVRKLALTENGSFQAGNATYQFSEGQAIRPTR